jgi:hypothetical protein
VRFVKEEYLSKLILFGETWPRRVVSQYLEHYHQKRNHQGRGSLRLFPVLRDVSPYRDAQSAVEPGLAVYSTSRAGGMRIFSYGEHQTKFDSYRATSRRAAAETPKPVTVITSARRVCSRNKFRFVSMTAAGYVNVC